MKVLCGQGYALRKGMKQATAGRADQGKRGGKRRGKKKVRFAMTGLTIQ